MKHLNLILALVSLIVWVALYLIYYKEDLFPWIANRFGKDKIPTEKKIEDGYFPDGAPIPFRENLYPSNNASKEGSPPGETEANNASSQGSGKAKDGDSS